MEGHHFDKFISAARAGDSELEADVDVKKGPWTEEEDVLLRSYVEVHGEGRWNSVAHYAGLKRTGKSCRLRWLNYLRPNVRRGNMTLQEQVLILELHSRWGNRWSKIAKYLPGRTDNEVKNYWRTRVQKQAKQLNCDVNSQRFRDTMRYVWLPQLMERIQASSGSVDHHHHQTADDTANSSITEMTNVSTTYNQAARHIELMDPSIFLSEMSSGVSSDHYSFEAQVSPVSEPSECYSQTGQHNYSGTYLSGQSRFCPEMNTEHLGRTKSGMDHMQGQDQQSCNNEFHGELSLDGGDYYSMDSLWNEENVWFLRQQLYDETFF